MADQEDYSALADPQFDPYLFANDLINITNSNIQQELDISTSIKKVKFDLNDLELQLKELIVQDVDDSIINEVIQSNSTESNQFSQISDDLTAVNANFNRLKTNLLKPYNQVEIYLNILKKIHTTSDLVRDVAYFTFLVSKIQQIEDTQDIEDDTTVLNLSTYHSNLNNHLNLNKNLKSLKLIRDYDSIQLQKLSTLENMLYKDLSNLINQLITRNTTKNILNDASIQSHFKTYSSSLYLINQGKLGDIQTAFYKNLISISWNNQINRVLTSSTQSSKISKDLTNLFKIYVKVLDFYKTVQLKNNESQGLITLSDIYKPSPSTIPEVQYWIDLFSFFKKSLSSTIQKGGPVFKQLKAHKAEIVKNFNDSITTTLNSLNLESYSLQISNIVNQTFDLIDNRS